MAKSFAAFDIDGTFIRWQLYHAIVDKLFELKYINYPNLYKVEKAKQNWMVRANEDSFNLYQKELIKAFDYSIVNLDVNKFNLASDLAFEEYKEQVYKFTRDLFFNLKKKNYLIFAISGSPEIIIKKMAKFYGFDDYASSLYEIKNKKLTGKKDIAVLNKISALEKLVKKNNVTWENSYAIGDSEGDKSMLDKVDNPIVFNPSKKLFNYAINKRWSITVERKNMIYSLIHHEGKYILDHD